MLGIGGVRALRALGVTALKRVAAVPDIPTISEQGLTGFSVTAWNALVVPRGQMKVNLLGMSFLDRLESWEVRADRLMLHGYP